MTFLAPWALALGAVGAAGLVLLHLVARQRPAAFMLPTARFVPDRRSLVSRAASRPRDLLLLLLRVLVVLLAATAFARPVFTATRASRARLVLLDRSALVGDSADAARRAQAQLHGGNATLVTFDSANLTAALIAARRAAGTLAPTADSVELVLLSPVAAAELDAATLAVRALWPGAITIERLAARPDSAAEPALERAMPLGDALGPALVHVRASATRRAVRVLRGGAVRASDSAFARAGGAVVAWDTAAAPLGARGLAVGDDVVVAAMGALPVPLAGRVVARWADGEPAAREAMLGAGCVRTVGVAMPSAGDLALRPAMQRIIRGLVAPCARVSGAPASDAMLAALRGTGGPAPAAALERDTREPSPIVPWLLGAALCCALLELAVRARSAEA